MGKGGNVHVGEGGCSWSKRKENVSLELGGTYCKEEEMGWVLLLHNTSCSMSVWCVVKSRPLQMWKTPLSVGLV